VNAEAPSGQAWPKQNFINKKHLPLFDSASIQVMQAEVSGWLLLCFDGVAVPPSPRRHLVAKWNVSSGI